MAIGARASGTWAVNNATTQTVTLPTHQAGDILVLVAAAKATTVTSLDPSITTPSTGWTRIASFADGTVNAGNGTGSVRQAIFYRIAASSSETNPVVTWGGSQTAAPGLAVADSFSKGGGEVWLQPVAVQAATNNATSISVTMGSNPGITAGDWGLVVHTTRDDSALTVPTWTATGATLAAVVEYPATAIADGTSNDMAGDMAYRSVTSGTASAAPVCTGTQAAAETGVTGFVRLRVATAAPQSVTPTTASVTLTTFAPTVTIPSNTTVTPTTATLTTARFAPTVTTPRLVTPTTASLTTSTFAPTISLPKLVTPTTASLTTSTFAPTVSTSSNVAVTPSTASLASTTFAPTILTPVAVTPTTATLSTATFAPDVDATAHVTIVPTTASLSLTTFVPTATGGQGLTVTPTTASLTTSTFAPTVSTSDNVRVTSTTVALTTDTFAPVLVLPRLVIVPIRALVTTTFAPTISTGIPPVGLPDDISAIVTINPEVTADAALSGPAVSVTIDAPETVEVILT